MPGIYFRYFEKDNLGAGAIWEDEWKVDDNYICKYILIRRKDGKPWTASTITLGVEQDYWTKDKAPVAIFGTDILNAMPINRNLDKERVFKWSLRNEEGETISVQLVLVLEKR